jgi:hypothetical protein
VAELDVDVVLERLLDTARELTGVRKGGSACWTSAGVDSSAS